MVPAIEGISGHVPTDLLEGAAIGVHVEEELAIAIITAFYFLHDMTRDCLAVLMIEVDDVVDIVHVHDEPTHLLGDLGLRVPHVVDDLNHHLANQLHVLGDAFEVDLWRMAVAAADSVIGVGHARAL